MSTEPILESIPRSSREVLIAANPKSGASSSASVAQALRHRLAEMGYQATLCTDLAEIRARATQLHESKQLRCVVSAGGDGTVAMLANMLDADTPFQLLPLGTENLLAKYLKITCDVDAVAASIDAGQAIKLDAGTANGKLFLVMVSCGFDAEVVREMHAVRKGHINRWSYAGPILRALRKYSFPKLKLLPNEEVEADQGAWVFVFNVPRYAAELAFCPQADPYDSRLDACLFKKPGIFSGLHYFWHLWRRKHQALPSFKHFSFRKLEITAPLDSAGNVLDVPFQVDGDPGGVLPLVVETLPQRLKLLVSR